MVVLMPVACFLELIENSDEPDVLFNLREGKQQHFKYDKMQ